VVVLVVHQAMAVQADQVAVAVSKVDLMELLQVVLAQQVKATQVVLHTAVVFLHLAQVAVVVLVLLDKLVAQTDKADLVVSAFNQV
jgi:ABC-type arginine/histidine transport system permease subunit